MYATNTVAHPTHTAPEVVDYCHVGLISPDQLPHEIVSDESGSASDQHARLNAEGDASVKEVAVTSG